MKVIRAKTAGFCMGVSLALKKLEEALLQKTNTPIKTLGPIIHNPQVLAEFAERGVICLHNIAEASSLDHVLIRAHGIPRREEEALKKKCASVADATCPRVKKAQLGIEKATCQGQTLLLFGEVDHPEVAGLISYANGPAFVFSSQEELATLPVDDSKGIVLASQTTQDRGIFEQISQSLQIAYPKLTVLSTICDATRQRQEEALSIAARVQVMVVIGGRTSGNTRRLAKLASEQGIKTYHVEDINEINREEFRGVDKAGLTAGASTPLHLIDEAEMWLAEK